MDGKAFVKLCKDCKLMSKGLTTTDVDLIFTKVVQFEKLSPTHATVLLAINLY